MMKVRIIGGGSVGSSLALKLETVTSVDYQLVYNSDVTRDRLLEIGIPSDSITNWDNANFDCDIIVICVKDSQIETVAEQLSAKVSGFTPLVFHTSGAKSKDVLAPITIKGCKIAAAHPYQTFAESESDVFSGAAWGIDADDDEKELIDRFIEAIGGKSIYLSEDTLSNKSLYHSSAVAASNFLALSIELAKNLAEDAGIDWESFLPKIMQTTLDNNLNSEKPAITGPVVRGDVDTVRNHVDALGESVNGVVYKNMSESLALMALDKGLISGEKFEEIMEALG
jgi:predicted short-subunit dehydrogenase-like oxidoreductase (DUF2520 family)